jgi:hypothetical protein
MAEAVRDYQNSSAAVRRSHYSSCARTVQLGTYSAAVRRSYILQQLCTYSAAGHVQCSCMTFLLQQLYTYCVAVRAYCGFFARIVQLCFAYSCCPRTEQLYVPFTVQLLCTNVQVHVTITAALHAWLQQYAIIAAGTRLLHLLCRSGSG